MHTTDSQHAALQIVADAVKTFVDERGWESSSPFTGHAGYVVLCHVQQAILHPDTEIYRGQRLQA